MINNLVNDFLNTKYNISDGETLDLFKQIIAYYNNTGIKYKVKNINELFRIWQKYGGENMADYYKWGQMWHTLWSWIDTSDVLTYILASGNEISFDMHDRQSVDFIKIKASDPQYDILIHRKLFISNERLKWSKGDKRNYDESASIETFIKAENDYDGWSHTYRNVNIYKNGKNNFSTYPAYDYVNNLNHKNNTYIPEGYQAYVPSYAQLSLLNKYDTFIVYLLKHISKYDYKTITHRYKPIWSSTEWGRFNMCVIGDSHNTNFIYKTEEGYIFPLFKKC